MALVRKSEFVGNLLDRHLVVCYALLDQLGPEGIDVIAIGDREAPLEIGTEIRFRDIEVFRNRPDLDRFGVVDVLMDVGHNLLVVETRSCQLPVLGTHRFLDQSKDRKDLVEDNRRGRDIGLAVVGPDVLNGIFQDRLAGVVQFQYIFLQPLVAHEMLRGRQQEFITRELLVGIEIIVREFYVEKAGRLPDVKVMFIVRRNDKQVARLVRQKVPVQLMDPVSLEDVDDFIIGMRVGRKVELLVFEFVDGEGFELF